VGEHLHTSGFSTKYVRRHVIKDISEALLLKLSVFADSCQPDISVKLALGQGF